MFQDTIFVDLKSEPERSNDNEIISAPNKHKSVRDLYSSNEAPTKVIAGGNFKPKCYIDIRKFQKQVIYK